MTSMSDSFRTGWKSNSLLLVLVVGCAVIARSAHANVYATNVKLNGGTTNLTAQAGEPISITYILNEPASGGVTIEASTGATVVNSLLLLPEAPGTLRGTNTVVWDGLTAAGLYSLKITARSSGYSDWTQVTDDSDPNTYVFNGRGIAVDRNAGSLYFGRVFVANSLTGFNPDTTPGDVLGILKFNADASTPEDGIVSTGGYKWPESNTMGLGKLEVSENDRVYVSNLQNGGDLLSWDPTFSTNSFVQVLQQTNKPPGTLLRGLAVTGQGTNALLWMSDALGTNGVLRWGLDTNGACKATDPGLTIVALSDVSGLTNPPVDVAMDQASNIYVCQSIAGPGDPNPRVFKFPAYDPLTNGGMPEVTATWAVGGTNDTMLGATGIAVDPTGAYVAVSFEGAAGLPGNTMVYSAATGALLAMMGTAGSLTHQDNDCAWDAAGNLYYIENVLGVWRAVSPPGTNQFTTAAAGTVQIIGNVATPPQITDISVSNGIVSITFSASASDTPSMFTVLGAPAPGGPFVALPNAPISVVSPGVFKASFPQSGSVQFYAVQRGGSPPPQAPQITGLVLNAGNVIINFTGLASDSANAFKLVSAGSPGGAFSQVSGSSIDMVSAGSFRATAPTNGPIQFYRVQR